MDDMTDQHDDPKFEAWLSERAKSYHSPLPTPRDEMWARIAAERQRRAGRVIELRPWMRWGLAAAAVLALGIGIGRWTSHPIAPGSGGTPVASAGSTAPSSGSAQAQSDLVYQVAATQYLTHTEAFLTSFRADIGSHGSANSVRFARQARGLLSMTRLMLDSPAAQDQQLRALLEDLELVLVQISQLDSSHDGPNHDTDLITQGMNQSNVLPKLRSAIPAGPVPVRTEGAL
jgi:hypothetical protein